MNPGISESLEIAIDGLVYVSETDEPFKVVCWPGDGKPLDSSKLLELISCSPDTPVEVTSLEDFFHELTTIQSWHGEEEAAAVRKYQNLQRLLSHELSKTRVFRVGEVEVEIYIVGSTCDGNWAGVKTTAVET